MKKQPFAKVWYYNMGGGDVEKPHDYPCGLILGDVKIAQDWGKDFARKKAKEINESLREWQKA